MIGTQQPLARADESSEESTHEKRVYHPIPTDVGSPQAKLVFLAVREYAPVDVEELKAGLGLSGLTLYPILRGLSRKGYVVRAGQTCTLAAEVPP